MAAKKKIGPGKKTVSKASPKKKTSPKKKSLARKKSAPKKGISKANKTLFHELKKVGLGIAILLAVCMTTAMLADIFLKSGRPVPEFVPSASVPATKGPSKALEFPKKEQVTTSGTAEKKSASPGLKEKVKPPQDPAIVYEVFDDVDPGHDRKPPVAPSDTTPKIAIIIDDIGYDKGLAMSLFDLDKDITFSVLPFSPFGKILAQRFSAKGAELMLHLPMEPVQYPRVNPGPGALLSSMSPDMLLDQLRKDLDAVPGVAGVNNHMGSKMTADSDKMNQIFTVLKKEDLFFIDSRTAPNSKGEASARLFFLKFSHRDIFLDNFQDIHYISGQFGKLVKAAQKHGTAIGIGHPYPATLETLKIELPKLQGRVQVVRASRLVAIPG
ncbi:MAG: divergent polysaccharide deacetylase family protein [Desulfobacter sp.]|nr:MAG: divergent polysaccharide deacetylase family protein [Desulfobacter sp.]